MGKILAVLKAVFQVVTSPEFGDIVKELKKIVEALKKLFEGFLKPDEE